MCRFEFLQDRGQTAALMQKLNVGPVILREGFVIRKEISVDDKVSINFR